MQLVNWGEQIKRELQASPLKAALLAIACMVFVWFWWPLVQGWLKVTPSTATNSAPAPVSAATALPAVTPVAAAGAVVKNVSAWRKIVEQRKHDPLLAATEYPTHLRDPFRVTAPILVADKDEEDSDASSLPTGKTPVAELPPLPAVTVESIAFGQTRRMAIVNGQMVREGDVLAIENAAAENTKDSPAIQLRVLAIRPDRVELDFGGRWMCAELPRRDLKQNEGTRRRAATP